MKASVTGKLLHKYFSTLNGLVLFMRQLDAPPVRRLTSTAEGGLPMQALALIIVYILTTATVQFISFLISKVVDYQYPTLGLMTFLVLFLGAFGLAWPIAVWLTEWLIRRAGYTVETEQSGLVGRQAEAAAYRALRKKA